MKIKKSRRVQAVAIGAVLIALGAATTLAGAGRDRPAAAPAPGPADLDRLAGVALAKLNDEAAVSSFAKTSRVTTGYSQHGRRYLGELTLSVACAGAGRITLSVTVVPSSESIATEKWEVARVSADCADDPVPARVTFVARSGAELIYQLIDSAAAADRAGFAYRLTSNTGKLLTGQEDEAYARTALHLTSDAGFGWGSGMSPGRTMKDEIPLDGRYTIAAACAGTGTIYLRIRKHRFTVKCSWPAVRYDFPLERTVNTKTSMSLDYRSAQTAPADVALQFIPR